MLIIIAFLVIIAVAYSVMLWYSHLTDDFIIVDKYFKIQTERVYGYSGLEIGYYLILKNLRTNKTSKRRVDADYWYKYEIGEQIVLKRL